MDDRKPKLQKQYTGCVVRLSSKMPFFLCWLLPLSQMQGAARLWGLFFRMLLVECDERCPSTATDMGFHPPPCRTYIAPTRRLGNAHMKQADQRHMRQIAMVARVAKNAISRLGICDHFRGRPILGRVEK